MPPRATNNPRQLRNSACGCKACLEAFPENQAKPRRDCIGVWQARYRGPDGRQKARSFEKKREAEAFLDEVRTTVRQGTYLDPKRGEITVTAWHELWWKTQETKGRPTTRRRKEGLWSLHIQPKWGDWKLNGIGFLDLDAWLQNEVRGYHTRKKILEFMRKMMQAAILDKRISTNPTFGIELEAPQARHPDERKPPTDEQCERILACIPEYYWPLLQFADETGMRWGEYTGLRAGYVDLDAATAKVAEVIAEDGGTLVRQPMPKTDAGFRTVPLSPRAVAAVLAMQARRPLVSTVSAVDSGMHPEEIIFVGPRGGVLSHHNFRRIWIKAIQEAGIARKVVDPETGRTEWWPKVNHYRHRAVRRFKLMGISDANVQAIVGHEPGSNVTSAVYDHAEDELVQSVHDAFARHARQQLRAVS